MSRLASEPGLLEERAEPSAFDSLPGLQVPLTCQDPDLETRVWYVLG